MLVEREREFWLIDWLVDRYLLGHGGYIMTKKKYNNKNVQRYDGKKKNQESTKKSYTIGKRWVTKSNTNLEKTESQKNASKNIKYTK